MKIAYKYCNGEGIAILQNLELKITPPNEVQRPIRINSSAILEPASQGDRTFKKPGIPRSALLRTDGRAVFLYFPVQSM